MGSLRAVSALLTGVLVLGAGNGLLGTLIPVQIELSGYSAATAAVLSTAYFVGLILGCLYAHHAITRAGHIRAFAAYAGTYTVVVLGFAIVAAVPAWVALRIVGGFCVAGLFMVIESWLNERASADERGSLLAVYLVALYLGAGSGQLLLAAAPGEGTVLFAVAAALTVGSLVPVSLTREREPHVEVPARLGLSSLFRRSPLGVVGCLVAGAIVGSIYGLAPFLVTRLGERSVPVWAFMATTVFGGMLLQWPVGRLSDRFDRRIVLLAVLLVAAGSGAALGFLPRLPPGAALIGAALFGGVGFTVYPIAIALANDQLDPSEMVSASGDLLLLQGVGAALAPLVLGTLMDAAGSWILYPGMAAFAAVAALYTAHRLRVRDPVPEDERPPFGAHPPTTPVAVRMGVDQDAAGDDGVGEDGPPSPG